MSARTVVQKTAEAVAFGIVSGKYAVGERLPSVRKLAAEYEINPSTVQVVLAHLQSSGFVSAHPGLGFIVKDIETYGGIATWRYIFRFAQQLPDRAAKIFEELLEYRIITILDALERIARNPGKYDPAPVRRAVEQLHLIGKASPGNYAEIARAEIHALRMLHVATGQTVITAVMNSISEVYLEVPAVMQTMSSNPKQHLGVWYGMIEAWEQGNLSERGLPGVAKLLRDHDRRLNKYFRELVSSPDYRPELPETGFLSASQAPARSS
ncbi:MAG: GntR family transcriptional regulator [Chrysiogenetes bacterium]|nr:GntR family transcriptional regulator [Chrysiogenetes bacterium]